MRRKSTFGTGQQRWTRPMECRFTISSAYIKYPRGGIYCAGGIGFGGFRLSGRTCLNSDLNEFDGWMNKKLIFNVLEAICFHNPFALAINAFIIGNDKNQQICYFSSSNHFLYGGTFVRQ